METEKIDITSSNGRRQYLRAIQRQAQISALRRLAGTAFFGQVSDEALHQGQVGAITLKTALLHTGQQGGVGEGFQMKRQVGGGDCQQRGYFTGNQA